jgi:hypothetical protein
MGVASQIYSGTKQLGGFYAHVMAWVLTVFGLIAIISGIYLYRSTATTDWSSVTGTVLTVTPTSQGFNTYQVSFTPDKATAAITVSLQSADPHVVKDSVTVYYQSTDPTKTATLNSPGSTKLMESGLIVLGVIMIGSGWLNLYLVRRYKVLGAAEGAGAAIGAAKNIIQ